MDDERSEVIEFMSAHGLSGGDEAAKIASLIEDNDHLRMFIRAIRPIHQYEVFEAIRPHLRFAPKPLWWLRAI